MQSIKRHPRGGPQHGYTSLIERLVLDKRIDSKVFSIQLGHHQEKRGNFWFSAYLPGTILFGAIDTWQFIPPLLTLPMLYSDRGEYWGYIIQLDEVYILGRQPQDETHHLPHGSDGFKIMIDSGFSNLVLSLTLSTDIMTLSDGIIRRMPTSNTTHILLVPC